MEAVGEAAGEAPECAFAERCSRCMAAAEPASEEAYSQLRLRVRHLVQGFCSSHLTRALAQAWQAWATRPAPGDELMRRFLLPLPLSSWLARCLLSRSARPKAFRQTSQTNRLPKVWVAMCLWRCSGREYRFRQSAHW